MNFVYKNDGLFDDIVYLMINYVIDFRFSNDISIQKLISI